MKRHERGPYIPSLIQHWDRHLGASDASTNGIFLIIARACSSQGFSAAHHRRSHDCGGMSMISLQPAALQKITARHLGRLAMLYVRQSTLHQVLENTRCAPRANTAYASEPLLWGGKPRAL